MADQLNQWILLITDPVLGWLLLLPSDLRIIIIGIATSLILKLVRVFTTNQSLLHRVAADKQRLAALIREAKAKGDAEAVKRFRATKNMVAMRVATQEFKPLLVAIVPLALLAVWAWSRLEFHPPHENEPVEFTLYTPVSAVGRLAHLVPAPGLAATSWVREIVPDLTHQSDKEKEPARVLNGIAHWSVSGKARTDLYRVEVRSGATTLVHPVMIGQRHYLPALVFHDDGWVTELRMRPVKLFNIIPGIPALAFPPWLMGYLLVVIVMMPISTRLTGIR